MEQRHQLCLDRERLALRKLACYFLSPLPEGIYAKFILMIAGAVAVATPRFEYKSN
jgi:hypothetical protein